MHRFKSLIPLALTPAVLAGCLGGGSPSDSETAQQGDAETEVSATLRRTSFGIPHIEADDFQSMGYAYGYAQAEDNLCLIAEDTLTIRGLRSRYFGPNGTYRIPSNGAETNNLNADFFWRVTATDDAIAPLRNNSDPEAVAASAGYVAGFNRYLNEIKAGNHPGRHERCRNADWLFALKESDMYRRYLRLAVLASSSVFVDGVATAQPPVTDGTAPPTPEVDPDQLMSELASQEDAGELPFPFSRELPFGSNMYGISSEASSTGESLLFGNPHFPWEKTERLYMAHLKVGDHTEIMGASLYGLPAVLIGFNEHFAWSHTVSTAYRFSFYELTLNPADPTQYLYNGEFVDMTQQTVEVEVLTEDGNVEVRERTLYQSHYGPMLTFEVSGVPVLNWSAAKAYTLRDANAENDRLLNQFFRWNQANSLEEFIELHASVLGVPWVNTVATGPGQQAYYGDVTVVPNVPDTKAEDANCSSSLSAVFGELAPGLPILDGSKEACQWETDADAPAPGIFGPENLPTLRRDDWVHNCNDSYWVTNPAEPITGFAAIIGDEETPRTLRTRKCMQQVVQRLNGSDGLGGSQDFTLDNLQTVVLDSTLLSEQLARQDVLNAYCAVPTLDGSDNLPVDITQACDALKKWDGSHNLDSRGGHIWREFWLGVVALADTSPDKWLTPFDASDPINTPRDLNVGNPRIMKAFADAVQKIQDSPIAFDSTIRDIQKSGIHDSDIPIFGGESFEGSFTIAASFPDDLSDGHYDITYGNSYIQTVTWNDNGQPMAEGFVTYAQSTDPASPYYKDMTEAYSAKQWIRFPFSEEEIAADELPVQYSFEELDDQD
ncbi:MAG: penicillin acylase family protein [Pseudomonadota bacterium]|nr:penicillin acylase family protein [Pseudomonadota bacterium]